MSFQSEKRLARLRLRGSRLFIPNLVLFATCFSLAFIYGRFSEIVVEQWQQIVVWSSAGAVTLFFWLIPVLRYLSTYLDISSTRVRYRTGLMGQNFREVPLVQIKDVQISSGRKISLIIEGQDPMVISGIPKHKTVALEIDRLAASI